MKEREPIPGRRPGRGTAGILSSLLLAAAFLMITLCCSGCTRPLREGEPAPEFRLEGLDGATVSLADLGGKVVCLHFWATWCPPCLEELPRLMAFAAKQDPNRFVLLPVSVDRGGPEQVRSFLRSWGLDTRAYLDRGGKIAREYGTIRYPETYILGPRGKLRRKIVGAEDWDPAKWERFLQKVIQEDEGVP